MCEYVENFVVLFLSFPKKKLAVRDEEVAPETLRTPPHSRSKLEIEDERWQIGVGCDAFAPCHHQVVPALGLASVPRVSSVREEAIPFVVALLVFFVSFFLFMYIFVCISFV